MSSSGTPEVTVVEDEGGSNGSAIVDSGLETSPAPHATIIVLAKASKVNLFLITWF
jgi:hypothetical protein